MFFSERIKSIKPGDKVLEVGPGGSPYHRSDVLLEKKFDGKEWLAQSGNVQPDSKGKKTFFYEGDKFPFDDKEFDYVICSQVLEHVDNVTQFIAELVRVAKSGYIEYPTVYYDYIYNFEVHISLLMSKNGTIYWMPKSETELDQFSNLQFFFRETLHSGKYDKLVYDLKEYFFQGFEWFDTIQCTRTVDLKDVCYNSSDIGIIPFVNVEKERIQKLESYISSLENSFRYKVGKFISAPFLFFKRG